MPFILNRNLFLSLDERQYLKLKMEIKMKNAIALKIIEKIYEGIDPVTGKTLPEESPLDHLEVNIALKKALDALADAIDFDNDDENDCKAMKKWAFDNRPIKVLQKENIEKGEPKNAGLRWTPEDESKLHKMYKAKKDVFDIAKALERTPMAIKIKLESFGHALGKLDVLQRRKLKKDREAKMEKDSYIDIEAYLEEKTLR